MMSDLGHCRASIARHSKSFALAARLLPGQMADEAAIVYAWCRRADDAVDGVARHEQTTALARLHREIDSIYAGVQPSEPTLRAFQRVARDRDIPREYPEELLAGMRMDIERDRYACLDDLLVYCFRVAGTVGLMMCHVMGARHDLAAMRRAAHLGIAMQLSNICRDVLEDWRMARLYLPEDRLAECGAPGLAGKLGGPFPDDAAEPAGRVVARLLREADVFYRSGDEGLQALSWRCALAVRAARRIYAAIGRRIEQQGCAIQAGRAVVPMRAKLGHVFAAGRDATLDAPRRLVRRLHPVNGEMIHRQFIVRFPDDVLPLPEIDP